MKNLNQDLNRSANEDVGRNEKEIVSKNNYEGQTANGILSNGKNRLGETVIGGECAMRRERDAETRGNRMRHSNRNDHKG